jgi:hypothetical protein
MEFHRIAKAGVSALLVFNLTACAHYWAKEQQPDGAPVREYPKELNGEPVALCRDILNQTRALHSELGRAWGVMYGEIETLHDAKNWLGLVGADTDEQKESIRKLNRRLWNNRGSGIGPAIWGGQDPHYTCLP